MSERKNRRVYTLVICGILVFLASVLIFVIAKPEQCRTSVYLGFLFLIIAEIVLFGGLTGLEFLENASQILLRSGCGFCITGYGIAGGIASMVYMGMNTNHVRGFVILQVILIFIASILFFVFKAFSHKAWERDEETLDSMEKVESLVWEMSALQDNPKYGSQFRRLAEELRYTDTSCVVEADSEIKQELSQIKQELLKDPYSEKVSGNITSVSTLIQKRKNQIKNKKHGGI